jgi:hypothetical protein
MVCSFGLLPAVAACAIYWPSNEVVDILVIVPAPEIDHFPCPAGASCARRGPGLSIESPAKEWGAQLNNGHAFHRERRLSARVLWNRAEWLAVYYDRFLGKSNWREMPFLFRQILAIVVHSAFCTLLDSNQLHGVKLFRLAG